MLLAWLDASLEPHVVLGKGPSDCYARGINRRLDYPSQYFISARHLLPTIRIIFMQGHEPR